MRIFIPIALLIVALVAYYFAWQHSAKEVRAEVESWIAHEVEQGRIAEHDGLTVRGFPYRMQVEVTAPHVADPVQGWSWQAEKITGFVLPYRLNHAVLVVQGEQRVEFQRLGRREVVTGRAEDERASIVVSGGDLERFSLEAANVTGIREIFFADDSGALERTEAITIGSLMAHTRRVASNDGLPDAGHHHAISLEAHDIIWDGHPYEGLGSDISLIIARVLAAGIPESGIGSVARDFMPRWHDNGGILFLDEAAIRWSEIEIAGTGVLELDAERRPHGEMEIFVSGYDRAIDAAVAGGALDPEYANVSKTVLDVIAALGGDPGGRIRAPLRLEGGQVHLGPAELMDLPPIY